MGESSARQSATLYSRGVRQRVGRNERRACEESVRAELRLAGRDQEKVRPNERAAAQPERQARPAFEQLRNTGHMYGEGLGAAGASSGSLLAPLGQARSAASSPRTIKTVLIVRKCQGNLSVINPRYDADSEQVRQLVCRKRTTSARCYDFACQ